MMSVKGVLPGAQVSRSPLTPGAWLGGCPGCIAAWLFSLDAGLAAL